MQLLDGPEQLTCYDVIEDVDEVLREILRPDQQYFVLGGIASGAILHPDSVFDHQTTTLVAAEDSSQPLYRDTNGSLRDFDFLVLDTLEQEQAAEAKLAVEEATGNELVVSLFTLTPERQDVVRNQMRKVAWTSKRTVDQTGRLGYELFPLFQEVSHESYDPWRLQLPSGAVLPMLNPAAHVLAYRMRSISGLRYKDSTKVEAMERAVARDQIFVEQVEDGELKTWKAFAEGINLLGEVDLSKISLAAIASWRPSAATFIARSRILRKLESNERLIKMAQEGVIQELLKPFVGSR